MEEQKNKEIKLNAENLKSTENPQEKIPYEKLAEIVNSLYNENKQLTEKLQQALNTLRSVNRLGYLLKIAEIANSNATYSFTPEFVTMCYAEIEDMMTPPTEEKQGEEKTEEGN